MADKPNIWKNTGKSSSIPLYLWKLKYWRTISWKFSSRWVSTLNQVLRKRNFTYTFWEYIFFIWDVTLFFSGARQKFFYNLWQELIRTFVGIKLEFCFFSWKNYRWLIYPPPNPTWGCLPWNSTLIFHENDRNEKLNLFRFLYDSFRQFIVKYNYCLRRDVTFRWHIIILISHILFCKEIIT